ncbi:MarR family winged helix-turn-helix transcriptional regulator [Luteococcus sediminum]
MTTSCPTPGVGDRPDVSHAISEVVSAVLRTRRRERRSVSQLESGQLDLLFQLEGRTLSIGELAEAHCLELSTASRRISRLAQLGLVEKQTLPDDRRIQCARLSGKGEALLRTVRRHRQCVVERALDGWDEADVEQLRSLSLKLVRELDRMDRPPSD